MATSNGITDYVAELKDLHPELMFLGQCGNRYCRHDDCDVGKYLPALIGVATPHNGDPVTVYSENIVIDILCDALRDDGLDMGAVKQDAREYFDYNIAGTYIGPRTPLFVAGPDIPHFQSVSERYEDVYGN